MEAILTKSFIFRSSVKFFAYFSPITLILFGTFAYFVILYNKKRARLVKFIDKLPGPAALPLIGNTIEVNVDHDGKFCIYRLRSDLAKQNQKK